MEENTSLPKKSQISKLEIINKLKNLFEISVYNFRLGQERTSKLRKQQW
jgi:hypothetical protein